MLRRSIIAVASVAAFSVSFVSTDISAATLGGGSGHPRVSGLHFNNRHFPRDERRANVPYAGYGYLPYGGFVGGDLSDYYAPDYANYFTNPVGLFSMLRLLDRAIPPVTPLSCKHSQETKTVPSEDGGERTITITRC